MLLQDQTILTDKEKGIHGNCLITTYACYLDFLVDDCPQIQHMFDCKKPNGFWDSVVELWLNNYGYTQEYLTEDPFKSGFDDYYFAWGKSERGVNHQVIYKDGKLFHDPHPSKTGIISANGFIVLKNKENKTDFKGWTLSEMPQEVVEAVVVCSLNQPVGMEMMKRIEATKKKYPEFFKEKKQTQ